MLRFASLTILLLGCISLQAQTATDSLLFHFKVNQCELDSSYMDNAAAMRRVGQLPGTITRVSIVGAASPEGSAAVNDRLSRQRAESIAAWLNLPDSVATIEYLGRDWAGLLDAVMADEAVPYRAEVISLIKEKNLPRLQALRGGKPYRYLLYNHFPALRAASVAISYENVEQVSRPATPEAPVEQPFQPATPVEQVSRPATPEAEACSKGYLFAAKTNMLYDLALVPNLGVEFPIGEHFSVGADWGYAWWHSQARNRQWRIYGGYLTGRYWFGNRENRPLTGHHVGVYANVLVYQIAFGGKGQISGIPGQNLWGKPNWGVGAEYGYSLPITRRLNLDFTLGLGYLGGEYRTYKPVDDCYVWQTTHRRHFFGPTKAEVSLVCLIGSMKGGKK